MITVRKSVEHDLAMNHATGRSLFLNDLPPLAAELVVHLVGSPIPKGQLLTIDKTAALKHPGVVAIFTAADVPGALHFGVIRADEAFLALDNVEYVGQPLAVIAAETEEAAIAAESLLLLDLRNEDPVFTIEEAIARDEWLGEEKKIERGDCVHGLDTAELRLDGVLSIGGQEHCYLETQAALAEPDPAGGIRLKSSTQHPTEIQTITAAMLGIGMHQVVVEAFPMGGAFGGKETQAAIPALASALVAHHTRRPARISLSRRTDMNMTGKRHDYQVLWQAGFDHEGCIHALDIQFYSNGGSTTDLSPAVLERSLLHATNAYYIPNVCIRGRVCRTNLPSNTAFRGFGAPQAVAAMENIIEAIAVKLGRGALEIRITNCYSVPGRDVTPYGQRLKTTMLPGLMREAVERAGYAERRLAIEQFNRTSLTHCKGISLLPVNFGISFTQTFLNQANALVNLYLDGTIQVSTGATEMGQGSNTKIRQLIAREFGVPLERVRVMPTSTEKNHNTSPTAASVSTDLNGMAALDAARKILFRLRQVAAKILGRGGTLDPGSLRFENECVFLSGDREPAMTLANLARRAHSARVDLGARGFYWTPGLNFDWTTGQGNPFRYFTAGCAVSEVCIDRSTGFVEVEQVDILMDTGFSINPGIDRGQIIGGFVQGMGWALREELSYENGRLTSNSLSTYKIPTIRDIPEVFNVTLATNPDPDCLVGAKGVGEPPLVLGLSVWTAVQHALSHISPGATRRLDLPATPERVLMEIHRLQASSKNVAPGLEGRISTPQG